MADNKPDKAQEEAQKKEQEESKKEVVSVCTLNLRQILVALHEKALSEVDGKFKSGDIDITIQNSAIEGTGGKDAKFYGAGQHIIAAIPKDNKGLDKNKIEKKDAVKPLQTYVQWFVGPDLKDKVVENILKPLEDGAEGKVVDNHEKKEDIEKSKADSVAGEKYKESTIFVPSFSQYLLTEEGEDISSDEEKKEDKSVKAKNEKDAKPVKGDPGKGPNQAQGWYVEYKLTIPGQKEHPIADAMKSFAKDLLKAVGIKFTSLFGGADGKVHTIGDLADGLDAIFGKMDASKFEAEFNAEMKKRMKQTSAQAQVWDTKTILKYLKNEVKHDKAKIAPVQYALCVRVDKNDKSYKLFNEDAVANITNAAIKGAMRGIMQKIRFGVKAKDVILVNNYKDNKKAKDNEKFDTDKAEGAVADSIIVKNEKPLISESICKKDLLDIILESEFEHSVEFELKDDFAVELMKLIDINEAIILEKGHKELDDKKWNAFKKLVKTNLDDIRKNKDKIIKQSYEDQGQMLTFTKGDEAKNNGYDDFIYALFDDSTSAEDAIKKLTKITHRNNFRNDIVYRFKYTPEEEPKQEEPKQEEPPKKEDPPEEIPEEIEKFEIGFMDKDPQSDEGDDPEYKTVDRGGSVTPPDPKYQSDKHEFVGWRDSNGKLGDFDNIQEPRSYMAEYKGIEPDKFPVTFLDQDFESGSTPEIDTQWIEKGKSASAPSEPQHDGYKFKEWSEPFDKVEGPITTVALFDKIIKIIPQAPKDPDKPEDVEKIGDPIEYDPTKKLEEQLPEAPEKDGWKSDGWDPDPSTIENPKDDIEITAKYKKDSVPAEFTLNIVNPDPEDPENPKSYTDVAKIKVIDGKYKTEDLKAAAKEASDDNKSKFEEAAKQNEDAFKNVDNIAKMAEKNKPYKFEGWDPTIEDAVKNGPKDGEDEVLVKAKYNNDIKAKHTDIDFYIVPMKGLKDKESKETSK